MDFEKAMAKLKSLEKLGMRFRIKNTRDLLNFCKYGFSGLTIHVGGTNGKGSAANALAECLLASGMSVGLYTSPEIFCINERIMVDGQMISQKDFADIVGRLTPFIDSMNDPPTFFEALTALALLHFERSGVDAVVLEAGMGGRLDSTNAVDADHTIITNISLDHMQYLGHTIEEIAAQKAGLITPGSNLITAASEPGLSVLCEYAKESGSNVISLGRDFYARDVHSTPSSTRFTLVFDRVKKRLASPMPGAFQAENLCCAAVCARLCGVGWDHIVEGIQRAQMPARLEISPNDPNVIVDCAHNPDGIEKSLLFIDSLTGYERVIAVCAFSKDKDFVAMSQRLQKSAKVIATSYPGPRSLNPQIIGELTGAIVIDDPLKAFEKARALAGPRGLVYVAGSIYLAACALKDRPEEKV